MNFFVKIASLAAQARTDPYTAQSRVSSEEGGREGGCSQIIVMKCHYEDPSVSTVITSIGYCYH